MRKNILQCFNWKLTDIIENLPKIKESGFNTIQTSPLQGAKERLNGVNWWILYQPTNYKIGNDLGSKDDLTRLCTEARKYGIDILVDVIFHHLANYRDNDISPMVDKDIANLNDLFYSTSFYNIQNYNNQWECTHYSLGGLPALNLKNRQLRKMQFDYLIDLRECGVKGARFDALRHLSPDDNYFEEMRSIVGNDFIDNSYGECIECSYNVVKEYQRYMKVGTDISIHKEDSNCVIFVYSHDHEMTFGRPMDDNWLNQEYRFLLDNYKADTLYYTRKYNNSWQYI